MANVVEEIRYNKVEDFINAISYKGDLYDVLFPNFIYRGVPTVKYDLIPSALRPDNEGKMWELCGMHGNLRGLEYMQIENENRLLKIFFKICDAKGLNIPDIERIRSSMLTNMDIDLFYIIGEKWLPKDLYAIAALAQHYGLPTRLLDWSKDIFIALYFAAIEAIKRDSKDDYMVLWALNISFINVTIPPLKIINPEYSGNPNLCAQQGVFTMWEKNKPIKSYQPFCVDMSVKIDRTPLDLLVTNYLGEEGEGRNLFYKILIPSNDANELYKYLRRIGYDASKLFPGYYGVVKSIEERNLALYKLEEHVQLSK